jgi:hypothetical protein
VLHVRLIVPTEVRDVVVDQLTATPGVVDIVAGITGEH